MGCGTSTIKCLLFLFNLIFCLGGLALLICGVIVQVDLKKYESIVGASLNISSITVLVIGCAIFVISFLGCCGAIRESQCMLISFAVVVFVLFLILVALGATMFILKGKVSEFIDREIEERANKSMTLDGLDMIKHQVSLQLLPSSCVCKTEGPRCSGGIVLNEKCSESLKSAASTVLNVIGGVALGIGVTQLVGVIFACTLASAIKTKKFDNWYDE